MLIFRPSVSLAENLSFSVIGACLIDSQDYMGNHEREKVVELNANMPKKDMIKVDMIFLNSNIDNRMT